MIKVSDIVEIVVAGPNSDENIYSVYTINKNICDQENLQGYNSSSSDSVKYYSVEDYDNKIGIVLKTNFEWYNLISHRSNYEVLEVGSLLLIGDHRVLMPNIHIRVISKPHISIF